MAGWTASAQVTAECWRLTFPQMIQIIARLELEAVHRGQVCLRYTLSFPLAA